MTPNPNLLRLHEAGVSIWLDTLSRDLLDTGEFAGLIRDYSVTGATSNPTIFAKAITDSDRYDGQLRQLAVVAVGVSDRLGEDRGIGGHTHHMVTGDQVGQAAGHQALAIQVIQPD